MARYSDKSIFGLHRDHSREGRTIRIGGLTETVFYHQLLSIGFASGFRLLPIYGCPMVAPGTWAENGFSNVFSSFVRRTFPSATALYTRMAAHLRGYAVLFGPCTAGAKRGRRKFSSSSEAPQPVVQPGQVRLAGLVSALPAALPDPPEAKPRQTATAQELPAEQPY